MDHPHRFLSGPTDVAQGNGGFALWGDVADSLDYHLWALSLIMGTPYRERPMHSRAAYDVTQLRYLRRVGEVQPAPYAACAATVQRCSKVKLLKRVYMMQMCDALQLVGPDEDARAQRSTRHCGSSTQCWARVRRQRAPSTLPWRRHQSRLRLPRQLASQC